MKNLKPLQSLAKRMSLAYFVSFLAAYGTSAQPLYISASSAQYMTYVEGSGIDSNGPVLPPESRTTFSASPISDELAFPVVSWGAPPTNYAIANAGLLLVSDRTGWGAANAEAVSQLWFSPLADQTQTLNFQIQANGSPAERGSTSGQINLVDLTANSQLWNYSWNDGGSGPVSVPQGDNIPWDGLYSSSANFSLNTDFLASHQYELTMVVCSSAGDDSESAQIQLTGLQVVPEPSGALLLTLCGGVLAFFRCLPDVIRASAKSRVNGTGGRP